VRFEVNLPMELISEYEEMKDKYLDGETKLDDLIEKLKERAFTGLSCMFRLQNEAKSLRQAEIMGKLPNSLRNDFVAARTQCEQEINIVQAEAEDLVTGFGEEIMRWAAKTIQETNKAKQQEMQKQMESEMTYGLNMINEASKKDPSLAKLTDEQKRQRVAQQIKIKQFIQHLKSRGLSQSQIELELRRNNIRIMKAPDSPQIQPTGPALKKTE